MTRRRPNLANNGVTVLSTADLDSLVWTNKQFIASGLAETIPVTYIDSMGLRRPTLRMSDLRRIFSRIFSGTPETHREMPRPTDRIRRVRPNVIPWHSMRPIRLINALLLRRQVLRAVPAEERSVLWTFSPVTYGLENYFDSVVYHSVDLLHTFPNTPSELLIQCERELLAIADRVIVSSRGILERMHDMGRTDTLLWENVADIDLFRQHDSSRQREERAVFAGNLTPAKVDLRLLTEVIEAGIPLDLVGPAAIDGTRMSPALTSLLAHDLVTYHGACSLRDVATIVGRARVGLIPYLQNNHTAGVFPMKVYEYLAAGLSVVTTPIQSLVGAELPVDVHVVPRESFASSVASLVDQHSQRIVDRANLAARPHSWTQRISDAGDLVFELREEA